MYADQLLDKWFSSDQWHDVLSQANRGCEDSMHLMELVNGQLESIIFHVKNKSSADRLQYDLAFFMELCDDFEVA